MLIYKVVFYIEGVEVEEADVIIEAPDITWATQAILLRLNNKTNVPSVYDDYSINLLS